MSRFEKKIKQITRDTDKYLNKFFKEKDIKSYLLKPIRYSLFSGGKRLRSKIDY